MAARKSNASSSPLFVMPTTLSVRALIEDLDMRSLAETSHVLERYRLPATLDDANAYLAHFHSVFTLLSLYDAYFPQEFACSTASIVPAEDAAYSEREREFFTLVDSRLFPLPWHLLDDSLTRNEREDGIVVLALGREWWDDLRDWELGWLLLLWLIGEGVSDELEQRRPDMAQLLASLPRHEDRLALDALERHCNQLDGPLSQLPTALRILFHDTGCSFLDAWSEGELEYLDWSREDMDRLIAHAQRMAEITAQAEQFISWIEANPIAHFKEVLTLWNHYTSQTQDNHILLITPHPTTLPNSQP